MRDEGSTMEERRMAAIAAEAAEVAIAYGQCAECGCPAFAGEGTYCARPSCGHHWKSHQAT